MKETNYHTPATTSIPLTPVVLCNGSPFSGTTPGSMDSLDDNLAESPIIDDNPLDLE